MGGPKRGSTRAQNTATIVCDLLFFVISFFTIITKLFGGLNYPQMANVDFRTYCNTFWNIFGTIENVTKTGPSDPRFITKILNEYKKNDGNILGKYYFPIYENLDFVLLQIPCTFFAVLKFDILKLDI